MISAYWYLIDIDKTGHPHGRRMMFYEAEYGYTDDEKLRYEMELKRHVSAMRQRGRKRTRTF